MIIEKFYPDILAQSIFDLDLKGIRNKGIDALIVDLDNTMIPRDQGNATQILREWVEQAKETGIKICIISNNLHKRGKIIAESLNLPIIANAGKPLSWSFRKGMQILESEPGNTAVIGDQIFTDVLGGNMAKMTTILVEPLSPKDLLHTKMLRKLERVIIWMRGRNKSGKKYDNE